MTESGNENNHQTLTGGTEKVLKTLSFGRESIAGLALSLFLVSPIAQLFIRFLKRNQTSRYENPNLIRYQNSIDTINRIMVIVAVILLVGLIVYSFFIRFCHKAIPGSCKPALLDKEICPRLLPFLLFILFVAGILVSCLIRNTDSWDRVGHYYMHESMTSFMIYPLTYFFCGTLLWSEKTRKILLYVLVGTSLPLHALALVDEWGSDITYFTAEGVTTVFCNSNHYGYYLAITLLAAALLFVYEKSIELRIMSALCGIIAAMVLVINNTLGAFLASLFVLVLFVIYCLRSDRTHLKAALLVLGVFLLITVLMSLRYNTIFSSLLVLSDDIGMIVADPLEADSAGSSRWRLWKETVRHMPEHPLIGFGVEGLLNLYGIGTPHNEFLQYAAFFGIPVMLYYIAACAIVLWRIFRNHRQMSDSTMICFFVSIGYLASSFFGVTIFYTTPFIYILLGMTYAEYLRNGKRGTQDSCDAAVMNAEGLLREHGEGAELLLISMVCKKLQKGKSAEEIAADLEEELSGIEAICEVAKALAPDYDADAIYRLLHK